MRRRAFTLVELLVVIGIIALLMSILFPVIGRVRKQADATKCMSNLRGMGQAWQMYSNQFKICVPGRLEKYAGDKSIYGLGDEKDTFRPRWYELLGAQVGQYANKDPKPYEDDTWRISNEWFLCPSEPEWDNCRNYPYGYNYQFLGNARPKGSRTAWGAKVWINYPVSTSRIAGSKTVMAADCMGTAAGKPESKRQRYYNDGTKDHDSWGNKGFLLDPPRLTARSDYADAERRNQADRSGVHARHLGKANVAFCDGHVELMTLQDLGYVVGADGSIPAAAAGAHNGYFSGTGEDVDPPSVE